MAEFTALQLAGLLAFTVVPWSAAQVTLCGMEIAADVADLSLASCGEGETIPHLHSLSSLQRIALVNLHLEGTIPQLSSLPALKELDLSFNHLRGQIPSLRGLNQLEILRLTTNQLTGSVPDLSDLSSLVVVDLSANELVGVVPDFSSDVHLHSLFLAGNQWACPLVDYSTLAPTTDHHLADCSTQFHVHSRVLLSTDPVDICGVQFALDADRVLVWSCPEQGTVPLLSVLSQMTTLYIDASDNVHSTPVIGHHELLETVTFSHFDMSSAAPDVSMLPKLQSLVLRNDAISSTFPDLSSTSLFAIDLGYNHFYGTVPDLSQWPALITLALENNFFDGAFPDLSGTPLLRTLKLSNNRFTCTIPSLSLSNLDIFVADQNSLEGSLPDLPSSLRVLNLKFNKLQGSIPDVSHLTLITDLYLGSNYFTDEPPSFSALTKLKNLQLFYNRLDGDLPDLTGLNDLTQVSLYNNLFTGTIPSSLGTLPLLTRLELSQNLLTGTIPWPDLQQVLYLFVDHNHLSGPVPNLLLPDPANPSLPKMLSAKLAFNLWSCPIPNYSGYARSSDYFDGIPCGDTVSICGYSFFLDVTVVLAPDCAPQSTLQDLPRLLQAEIVNLSRLSLTGGLPENLYKMTKLRELRLARCNLDGTVPELPRFLRILDLGHNNLHGSLPYINHLVVLEKLHLEYNALTGSIPRLYNLLFLTDVTLDHNQFSQGIPALGALKKLRTFTASSNQLTGSIPSYTLLTLRVLALDDNQLSGDCPEFTGTSVLTSFTAKGNQLDGTMPEVSSGLLTLQHIDVSDNQLHGAMPSFQGLHFENLYLSGNPWDCPVPDYRPLATAHDYTADQPCASSTTITVSSPVLHEARSPAIITFVVQPSPEVTQCKMTFDAAVEHFPLASDDLVQFFPNDFSVDSSQFGQRLQVALVSHDDWYPFYDVHLDVSAQAVCDGTYTHTTSNHVQVIREENDQPGLVVFPFAGLSTSSFGGTTEVFITLASQLPPDESGGSNVVVHITADDGSQVQVEPVSLEFTPDNWDSVHCLHITGLDNLPNDSGKSVPWTVTLQAVTSGFGFSEDVILHGLNHYPQHAIRASHTMLELQRESTAALSIFRLTRVVDLEEVVTVSVASVSMYEGLTLVDGNSLVDVELGDGTSFVFENDEWDASYDIFVFAKAAVDQLTMVKVSLAATSSSGVVLNGVDVHVLLYPTSNVGLAPAVSFDSDLQNTVDTVARSFLFSTSQLDSDMGSAVNAWLSDLSRIEQRLQMAPSALCGDYCNCPTPSQPGQPTLAPTSVSTSTSTSPPTTPGRDRHWRKSRRKHPFPIVPPFPPGGGGGGGGPDFPDFDSDSDSDNDDDEEDKKKKRPCHAKLKGSLAQSSLFYQFTIKGYIGVRYSNSKGNCRPVAVLMFPSQLTPVFVSPPHHTLSRSKTKSTFEVGANACQEVDTKCRDKITRLTIKGLSSVKVRMSRSSVELGVVPWMEEPRVTDATIKDTITARVNYGGFRLTGLSAARYKPGNDPTPKEISLAQTCATHERVVNTFTPPTVWTLTLQNCAFELSDMELLFTAHYRGMQLLSVGLSPILVFIPLHVGNYTAAVDSSTHYDVGDTRTLSLSLTVEFDLPSGASLLLSPLPNVEAKQDQTLDQFAWEWISEPAGVKLTVKDGVTFAAGVLVEAKFEVTNLLEQLQVDAPTLLAHVKPTDTGATLDVEAASMWLTTVEFEDPDIPEVVPFRPQASLSSDDNVLMSWVSPDYDDDDSALTPLTHYSISVSRGYYSQASGDIEWGPRELLIGNTCFECPTTGEHPPTWTVVDDLPDYAYYSFAVAASNRVGRGSWSLWSDAVQVREQHVPEQRIRKYNDISYETCHTLVASTPPDPVDLFPQCSLTTRRLLAGPSVDAYITNKDKLYEVVHAGTVIASQKSDSKERRNKQPFDFELRDKSVEDGTSTTPDFLNNLCGALFPGVAMSCKVELSMRLRGDWRLKKGAVCVATWTTTVQPNPGKQQRYSFSLPTRTNDGDGAVLPTCEPAINERLQLPTSAQAELIAYMLSEGVFTFPIPFASFYSTQSRVFAVRTFEAACKNFDKLHPVPNSDTDCSMERDTTTPTTCMLETDQAAMEVDPNPHCLAVSSPTCWYSSALDLSVPTDSVKCSASVFSFEDAADLQPKKNDPQKFLFIGYSVNKNIPCSIGNYKQASFISRSDRYDVVLGQFTTMSSKIFLCVLRAVPTAATVLPVPAYVKVVKSSLPTFSQIDDWKASLTAFPNQPKIPEYIVEQVVVDNKVAMRFMFSRNRMSGYWGYNAMDCLKPDLHPVRCDHWATLVYPNDPNEDTAFTKGSPVFRDTTSYDRGHIVPNGDFDYHELLGQHTFRGSNMAPQRSSFNRVEWKNLEHRLRKSRKTVRDLYLADQFDVEDDVALSATIYVVTGVMGTKQDAKKMDETLEHDGWQVAIPRMFFKAVCLPLPRSDKQAPEFAAFAIIGANVFGLSAAEKKVVSDRRCVPLKALDTLWTAQEKIGYKKLASDDMNTYLQTNNIGRNIFALAGVDDNGDPLVEHDCLALGSPDEVDARVQEHYGVLCQEVLDSV